jgi:hypothetical protein
MKIKYLLIPAAAIGIISAGTLIGANAAQAEDMADEPPPIVQRIAEAFGLDQNEVAAVFEEERQERHQEHLDNLVEDGVITEEQRTLLEEKQEEMRAEREAIRDADLTSEERHDAMEELRNEMETWAEENGIDLPMQGFGPMGGRKGGPGEGMMHHGYETEADETE